jgi:hypothetical protein
VLVDIVVEDFGPYVRSFWNEEVTKDEIYAEENEAMRRLADLAVMLKQYLRIAESPYVALTLDDLTCNYLTDRVSA